jgi:hypothetical protein
VDARSLALLGAALRGAWGVGAFAAPKAMGNAQLTGGPDLDLPDPRLYVRGFGAHQVLIAGFTLAALGSDDLLRPALLLNVLLDGVDIASAAAEVAARGRVDRTLAGGFAISIGGGLMFLAALRALDRS